MTYNPCGRGVDFGRRSYTTTARPFRDSNITTTILWYPADRKKGPLPFPSRISSLDWMEEPHRHEGVGEVWNTPRDFVNNRGLGPVAGDHVCGTEDDFRNGARLADGRPVLTYLPSGLPTCCDPGRREAIVALSIEPRSFVPKEKVYRRSTSLRIQPVSTTIRSDPFRSSLSLRTVPVSTLDASDPRHSTPTMRLVPVSTVDASDPRHSTPTMRLQLATFPTTTPLCAEIGATCGDAVPTSIRHTCTYEDNDAARVNPLVVGGWKQWLIPLDAWRLTITAVPGAGIDGFFRLWEGDDCDHLTEIHLGGIDGSDVVYDFSNTNERVWLQFAATITGVPHLEVNISLDLQ